MTSHFTLVLVLTLLAGAVYPAKGQQLKDKDASSEIKEAELLLKELEDLVLGDNNNGGDHDMAIPPGKRQSVCNDPLGMESGAIPDSSITASSSFNNGIYAPARGRLHDAVGGWGPRHSTAGEWLQVDLGERKSVSATAIQGSFNTYWVKSYLLQYSLDGIDWTTYKGDDGSVKVFSGNNDATTPVRNTLDNPIQARFVRFLPQTYHSWLCMRVELYGCVYRACPEPPTPANTIRSACSSPYIHGEKCTYRCTTGFTQASGSSEKTCIDGQWTGSDLVCDLVHASDPNIASGRAAFQSSVNSMGFPGLAIDGNRSPKTPSSFCTKTYDEDDPYWYVDLGYSVTVDHVTIVNRQDSLIVKITPFDLHVGDSTDVTKNPMCGGHHHFPRDETEHVVHCRGMRGRYVGIRLPGKSRILSLCEVEVYAATNVAWGKPTVQSKVAYNGVASRATDGCRDPDWDSLCCTSTPAQSNPWLRVDLGTEVSVRWVVIINRQDKTGQRLDLFELYIGNEERVDRNRRCGSVIYIPDDKNKIATDCNGLRGRYVGIRLPGNSRTLSICEVEVYEGTVTRKRTSEVRGTEGQGCGEHQAGDTWLSDDGKENCICEMNQTVCYEVICGESGEDKPFLGKDGLWTCPEPAAEEEESGTVTRKRTSEVRGTEGQDCGEHQEGDTWLSDDGEKNCICEMNQTVCYEVICGEVGKDKPFLGKDGLWTCPEPAAEEEESD